VIAYDIRENPAVVALGIPYMSKEEVLAQSDILSLHVPLLPSTYHIIDRTRCATTL
jgi:D-lactate dehydrogenase